MFSNMKNKIREKTGSELPKLALTQKSGIGRHSRQGSETSLSSLDHPPKEELSPLPISNNEIVLADGKVSILKNFSTFLFSLDRFIPLPMCSVES